MNSSRFYYCFARVRKHRSLLFVNGALCGCEQSTTKVVVHSSPTTPFLLNRNRWSTIPPPVFLCCCEARVNCSFYKGLPHAVRSTSVAWPLRMGIDSPARVKSRSEGRSVVKLPVLPIGLLPTPENNTHLFIHPVKSIFFFCKLHNWFTDRTFISILLYFHRRDIDNVDKKMYRINVNHFTSAPCFD